MANNYFLEESVLWYCLDMLGLRGYKSLSIHERICFKQSYYDLSELSF